LKLKNIILISIDNLRFDCVGYQPDKKELVHYDVLKYLETPTLDRLAEKSICFTQCISTNTYTTAAHASILTGLYPPRHGVREFYEKKLSREVYTLAEVLKVFGYETVMMTDTNTLFLPLELNRGFDHVFHTDDQGLLKFLDENREKKLFVFVHFFDVHEPFLLSHNPHYICGEYIDAVKSLYEKFNIEIRFANRNDFKYYRRLWRRLLGHIGYKTHKTFLPLYVRGVSRFDQGRFKDFMAGIDLLGLLKDSLMVIVSDHGEGKSAFESPDIFTHGGNLFDSVIRVPLMVYHQDFSHQLIHNNVSIVDIFSTILDLSIEDKSSGLLPYSPDGISLHKLQRYDTRPIYSETWSRDNRSLIIPNIYSSYFIDQRSVRVDSHKFLIYGEPEFLDNQDNIQDINDELFVQNVYRGLLYRFEGYWEYCKTIDNLKAHKMTKSEFLNKIMYSLEYRSKSRYVMYDLQKDPFEEKPLHMVDSSGYKGDSERYFDTIRLLSKNPVISDDIFPQDNDTILGIMKNTFQQNWEEKAGIFLNNKHLFTCLIEDFLHHQKISKIALNKKYVGDMILTSTEFRRFLLKRMSKPSSKLLLIKNVAVRCIPYDKLYKIYFFLAKIFPRETRRGRLWNRFMAKLLNS